MAQSTNKYLCKRLLYKLSNKSYEYCCSKVDKEKYSSIFLNYPTDYFHHNGHNKLDIIYRLHGGKLVLYIITTRKVAYNKFNCVPMYITKYLRTQHDIELFFSFYTLDEIIVYINSFCGTLLYNRKYVVCNVIFECMKVYNILLEIIKKTYILIIFL